MLTPSCPVLSPVLGAVGQHRDESETFPAIQWAPIVNQNAHRHLIAFMHYFVYTGFHSFTTIAIWDQRILCHGSCPMYCRMLSHPWPLPGASWVVLVVKNLPANAGVVGNSGLIPGSGRSPGVGHGHPFQYSCPENPMDRGTWWVTVHWVSKSHTWLKQLCMHACKTSAH